MQMIRIWFTFWSIGFLIATTTTDSSSAIDYFADEIITTTTPTILITNHTIHAYTPTFNVSTSSSSASLSVSSTLTPLEESVSDSTTEANKFESDYDFDGSNADAAEVESDNNARNTNTTFLDQLPSSSFELSSISTSLNASATSTKSPLLTSGSISSKNVNSAEEEEEDEDGEDNSSDAESDADSHFNGIKLTKEERSLIKLQKFLEGTVESVIKSAMPSVVRSSYETNVSSQCTSAFLNMMRALQAGKQWAFRMLDSSGKPPSGILEGTLTDFGSFDQCLSIDTFKDAPEEQLAFVGKYCIMDVKPAFDSNVPTGSQPPANIRNDSVIWHPALQLFWSRNNLLSFRYGLCAPSLCSQEDLRQLTSYFFEPTGMSAEVNFCQQTKDKQMTGLQLAILCCLMMILFAVVIGTSLEIVLQKLDKDKLIVSNKKSLANLLMSFSIIKNTRKLLASDNRGNSSGLTLSLQHLDGVRFLSTCWIIMGHTYFFTDFVHYHHFRKLADFRLLDDNFWFMPIANFTLSVDTYFFISGMLVVYSNWKKLNQSKGKINALDFMIHRVWRIWPPYMVTIALVLVLPLLGSGPLWPQAVENSAAVCRQSWWQNLLFINNLQKPDEVCLFHTWFLSSNIQYHLASILILFVLVRYPKTCITLMSFGVAACVAGVYYYAQINQLRIPTVIADDVFVDNEDKILTLYVAPYNHFASYLIGIIFGYFLTTRKSIHFTSKQRDIGWAICLSVFALVIFTPYKAFKGEPVSLLFSSLYISLHRPIWAICFGWLVVCCSTGYGGFINKLLAYRFFRAPSALSYLAYLIHPVLMLLHTGNVRERVYLSHYQFLNTFLARTVLAFGAAYLLYVTVELPFAQLERYVFPKQSKAKKAPVTSNCTCTFDKNLANKCAFHTDYAQPAKSMSTSIAVPQHPSLISNFNRNSFCVSCSRPTSTVPSTASCVHQPHAQSHNARHVHSLHQQHQHQHSHHRPVEVSHSQSLHIVGLTDTLARSMVDSSILRADSLHGPTGSYRPRPCDSSIEAANNQNELNCHQPTLSLTLTKSTHDPSFVTRSASSSSLDGHN